jgi:hypothetical protein
MKTPERNQHLRELADMIAEQVAPVIGLARAPKCDRITRRRGHGGHGRFSVPEWTAAPNAPTEYFAYYVAHEVCHSKVLAHGPAFMEIEDKALAALGLRPVRCAQGNYLAGLTDLAGNLVCVRDKAAPGSKWRGNPRRPQPGEQANP